MEVSKSGYYAWKKRSKSQRRIDNEELLIEIRCVFVENDGNYGSPRIWESLKETKIPCSENRVARLMREEGLVAIQRRKCKATTNSKHNWPIAPNLLERNFSVGEPNRIWVTDITYIWTWEGYAVPLCLDQSFPGKAA